MKKCIPSLYLWLDLICASAGEASKDTRAGKGGDIHGEPGTSLRRYWHIHQIEMLIEDLEELNQNLAFIPSSSTRGRNSPRGSILSPI